LHTGSGKVLDGQFYWGGTLLNCNAGAQRSACCEWKPQWTCKGISWLNCECDGTSRCESRS